MNIDDMPVGKGVGGAGGGNGTQHSRFDDNNNADSRFSSSAANPKKKNTPRAGRGEYNDEIGSPAPHGQDSEVPYSRVEDRDSPRNQGGLTKARAQRQKNAEGYGEDFGSGGDAHNRWLGTQNCFHSAELQSNRMYQLSIITHTY